MQMYTANRVFAMECLLVLLLVVAPVHEPIVVGEIRTQRCRIVEDAPRLPRV